MIVADEKRFFDHAGGNGANPATPTPTTTPRRGEAHGCVNCNAIVIFCNIEGDEICPSCGFQKTKRRS